jgi:hypothetical protein
MNRRLTIENRVRRDGRAALLLATLALGVVSACGKGGTGEAGDEKPAPAKPAADPAKAPTATTADTGGTRIDGRAIATDASPAGAESALQLVLGDSGRLGGEIAIGGAKCAITGAADDAFVRGWLRCPPAADGAAPRRGTLVGEKAGGSYSGTFAISDDGAANVTKGTWKAGK